MHTTHPGAASRSTKCASTAAWCSAHDDPGVRGLFAASVDAARRLGTTVVVDGIDDADTGPRTSAGAAGCDAAQGDFIATPMVADDLPAWLASWNRRAESTT